MMKPISHSLRDVLVRQGIANAKPVGAGKVRGKVARTVGAGAAGIGADDQGEEPGRPLAGMRKGGERTPMGMGKTGAAKAPASFTGGGQARFGESRSPVLQVHVNPNVPTSTRKRTQQVPFLVVV